MEYHLVIVEYEDVFAGIDKLLVKRWWFAFEKKTLISSRHTPA